MKRNNDNACFNFFRNVFAGPHNLILGVMNVMGDVIRQHKPETRKPFVLRIDPFAEYNDGMVETPIPAIRVAAIPVDELFVRRGKRYVPAAQAGQLQAGERVYYRTARGKQVRYTAAQ